jgi:hypothetical protein
VNLEASQQKTGIANNGSFHLMYSPTLLMAELQTAKRKLLRVFEMLDDTSKERTQNAKIVNTRESVAGLTHIETSLDVRRSTTAPISRGGA